MGVYRFMDTSLIKQVDAGSIPRIDPHLCQSCAICSAQKSCAHKAVVVLDRGEMPWIDASRCYACRACIVACEHDAIVLGTEYQG